MKNITAFSDLSAILHIMVGRSHHVKHCGAFSAIWIYVGPFHRMQLDNEQILKTVENIFSLPMHSHDETFAL